MSFKSILKNIINDHIIFYLIRKIYKKDLIINQKNKIKIERLKVGRGVEKDRFNTYQKDYINFDIKKNEKVLDIGSGGYPFPYATCLTDLYIGNTTHRTEKLITDRPFIACDIINMPFKDKEFDFVYCSHVLEHIPDPAKACIEIMRIGKRGYIETPTKTSDIMFNFTNIKDHHKWHIEILGNTIIFMEWKNTERRDVGTNYFFKSFLSEWDNPFQKLIYNNRDIFVNMFLWKSKFDFLVINKEGEIIDSSIKKD